MGAGIGDGFVGRDRDLAALDAALTLARGGTARTVIVAGEAGIGKTRLVERLADGARADGWAVLAGADLQPGNGAIPYAPFVEALRGLVRAVEPARWPALLGPGRTELGRLLPELATHPRSVAADAAVEGSDAAAGLEGDRSGQARLFEAVLSVVERLVTSSPVILIVDDVQWADDGTRGLLGFLVRSLRASPVLVLVTLRTDGLDRRDPVVGFLAELERDDGVERLDLGPLDRAALARLLASRVGREPTTDEVDALVSRSDGNPFFAEQLAATDLRASDRAAPLPSRLEDILTARLAGLPDETQAVLHVAAAAGPRFDDALLAAVMRRSDAAIGRALRDAVEEGIIVRVAGGYAFRHWLLREVAEAALLIGERERLHGAFARELARRGEIAGVPVSPEELAEHWDAAGAAQEARPAHLAAGVAAEHVYAFVDARRHYERALALWPTDEAPSGDAADPSTGLDRVATLQRAAECAVLTGAPERAVELGHRAIDALEVTPGADPARLGALQERLRWYLWESGDVAGAAAAVAEALRLIPARPPSTARARALAQAAGIELLTGEYDNARTRAVEALAVARASTSPGEEALALGVLGWATAALGDVDAGIEMYREALALAERLGGAEGIAIGHANLAALLDRVGRTRASLEAAQAGMEVIRRIGVVRTYGGVLLGHAAKALFDLGRLDDAAAVVAEGLALDPEGRGAGGLRIHAARIDLHQGRSSAARRQLDLARAGAPRSSAPASDLPPLLAASAELGAWEGRIADVRAAVDEGLAELRDDRPLDPAYGRLAWAALRAEADVAIAARLIGDEPALAEVDRRVTPIVGRLTRRRAETPVSADPRRAAVALICQGELARIAGHPDPETWAAATAAWTDLGRPVPAAYAGWRAGEAILASKGPREAAAAALRTAVAAARAYGGTPIVAEIEVLARHARIALEPAERHDPGEVSGAGATNDDPDGAETLAATYGLTDREAEVLRLVAAGWSNQQIADALFITRKTASVHVSNILGKFGVRNRVEAAAIAHRLGLAGEEPPPAD